MDRLPERAFWPFACAALTLLLRAPAAAAVEAVPEPPAYHLILGLRGFGGGAFGEQRAGLGGLGLLAALPFAQERYELELSLGAAGTSHDVLGLAEVAFKRVFEARRNWSPHVIFGPLFSLDFHGETTASGGLVAGGGITYWRRRRIGVVADLAFRALFGRETRELLTMAVGFAARI